MQHEPGSSSQLLRRRDFLQTFALLGASSLALDAPWKAVFIGELQASPAATTAVLQLRVSDFPALQKDFGSVRIGTSKVDGSHFPAGLFYPLLVNRASANQFHALDSECTHAGCVLPAFSATTKYSQCPCHGSRFSIDGTVLRGPANGALRRFPVAFDGVDTLTIRLPAPEIQGLDGFTLSVTKVLAPEGRVAIRFLSYQNIRYELKYRASLAAAWETVPFALSAAATLDRTLLDGTDDYAELFAAAPEGGGFFAVAMKTGAV